MVKQRGGRCWVSGQKGFVNARGGIQWNNDSSSNNDVDGVCDLGKDISEVLAVSLRL